MYHLKMPHGRITNSGTMKKLFFLCWISYVCTYLGSAVSSYGNGAIVEHFSWNTILYCWCICAAVGVVSCGLAAKKWKQFSRLTLGSDL